MIVKANPKQKSQTQRAYEDIRALIFNGELPAGTDHLEKELADRLGMSRTPVREATLMLEAEGLLAVRARKGVRIQSLSAKDMSEIYEVLAEMESLAAYKAGSAKYTKEELSGLLNSIEQMEETLAEDDRDGWALADGAFHDELVRLGGNQRVKSIVSNFNDQVRRARALTLHIRKLPQKANDDHRALYEALLRGDPETARSVHAEHRAEARIMMLELLERYGLKQV